MGDAIKIFRYLCAVLLVVSQSSDVLGQQTAVLVLGTGRSGTSALSGVLSILGVDFGSNFKPHTPFTPKGDFENIDQVGLIMSLRNQLGMQRWNPYVVRWNVEKKREAFKELIKKSIQNQFGSSNIFGVKQPFLALFIDPYVAALRELGIQVKIVLALREPREVVASYQKRWPEQSKLQTYILISTFLTSILKDTGHHECLVIYFDDLLEGPDVIADQLADFIPGLYRYEEKKDELSEFLDQNLKHHHTPSKSIYG